jgi:predicted heme/steroid binding protein
MSVKLITWAVSGTRATSPNTDSLTLAIRKTPSLTASARIYKEGTPVPAFTPMTKSGTNFTRSISFLNENDVATYIIEYKDQFVEKVICKLTFRKGHVSYCYPDSNSTERFLLDSYEGSFRLSYVNHYLPEIPSNLHPEGAKEMSLDGGSWLSSDYDPNVQLTITREMMDSEMEGYGIFTHIDTVDVRRISNGCTSRIVEDVTIFIVPQISHTKQNVTTFGGNNGSINLSVSGGSGSYTYAWADGPTTEDRTGLTAGTYTVTVTDTDTSIKAYLTVVISEVPELTASHTKTNSTAYNADDGTINVAVNGGVGPYAYAWSDGPTTQNRSGLAPGIYGVTITDTSGQIVLISGIQITEPGPPTFNATYTKSDVTTFNGADGAIDVSITGGVGPFTYLWNDGATSQDRIGLIAGTYSVLITDTETGDTRSLQIVVLQPNPPLPEVEFGNFLQVPLLNSIFFVIPETVDNINVMQTPDNTLLCKQYFPGFQCTNYYQKVGKYDNPIVHINSSFENHSLVLKTYPDGELVKAFSVFLKEQNIGVAEDFAISIRNHVGFVGQSRVYFASGDITVPIEQGETFEILNSLDGFNGSYAVVSIQYDSILGVSYMVINAPYTPSTNSSNAIGRFISTYENFNVLEAPTDLSDVDDGKYYMELVASDNAGNSKTAISEPIDLRLTHPNTVLIEYRNIDNAFDITWTTGYIGRVRIEALVGHKRFPGGERTMSRDADFSPVKVSARKQRIFLLETFMLPPYLHEKLSVIFDTDYWKVNNIEYQATDGYAEPEYIYKFKLANSSIRIEQVGWFNKYNSHDIGTVNDSGYLLDVGNGDAVLGL